MGNRLCCGRNWSCPSTLRRKKKTGSQARPSSKQQQQRQNGRKGPETRGHTYERVLEKPESPKRRPGVTSEDSSVHYADIQVCSRTRSRSAREVKDQQVANATEYATLCFPQATPRYDRKNGTLV